MKATLVEQPALRLVTAQSKSVPDGNREAFASVEAHLDSMRGRRFYGVIFSKEEGLEYHAGLVPDDDSEERRFVGLGFPAMEVGAGSWARVKLFDWTSKTDQIGPTFGKLIGEYGIDPSRPQLEFYRSQRELHLLVPVTGEEG